jgi:hypothetical protein
MPSSYGLWFAPLDFGQGAQGADAINTRLGPQRDDVGLTLLGLRSCSCRIARAQLRANDVRAIAPQHGTQIGADAAPDRKDVGSHIGPEIMLQGFRPAYMQQRQVSRQ